MKSRIKQITLLDGKQLFYPSEEEYSKLWDQIETVTIEERMTKEEYLTRYVLIDALTITKIELKDYYKDEVEYKNKGLDGY